MCICDVDVRVCECVVSECERVNEVDLDLECTYLNQIYIKVYLWQVKILCVI